MSDEDISLRRCKQIDFIDHHKRLCNKSGKDCDDKEPRLSLLSIISFALLRNDARVSPLLSLLTQADFAIGLFKHMFETTGTSSQLSNEQRSQFLEPVLIALAHGYYAEAKAGFSQLGDGRTVAQLMRPRFQQTFGKDAASYFIQVVEAWLHNRPNP
jgi:hypothetical protein